MAEIQNEVGQTMGEPKNRSAGALILFLLLAIPMPVCLFLYHISLWFLEQLAISSGSLDYLASAGMIGLAAQAVLMTGVAGGLWYFSKDDRFKPVYAGWLAASVMAFPAIVLRFFGPNRDQLGWLYQILICVTAFFVVSRLRNIKLDWKASNVSISLLLAAFGTAPFVVLGAFGIAAVLSLLGSVIGYDGSQLILIALLPSFAFAIAVVMPSRLAGMVLTGSLASVGFIFFDPTELTIVLIDIAVIAIKTCAYAFVLGLAVGLIGLTIQLVTEAGNERRPERVEGSSLKRVLGWVGAGGAWLVVVILFITNGNHGFYGDRLFVILKDQADLSDVRQIQNIDERRSAAYNELIQFANESQTDLRKAFDSLGVKYTPYYLENAIEVRGGTLVRLYLLTRPEVDRVIPSQRLRPAPLGDLLALNNLFAAPPPSGVQWNVSMIGADKVWDEYGVRGEGIVIGQSDSGVDVTHPELQDSYRGKTEGNDYNWFDPWNERSSPYDENGHGTHTLGTVLGQNGIGVAPGATWFACANLERGLANPALYLDCMQFMLAPFPQGGDPFVDGDPTRAADVLNNSWGCPEIEGCDPNALIAAANHLRDAGIFVVVSTGNDGPNCSTVNQPLALYDSVFSVGAVDRDGNVTEFSSRGPVTVDGSNRIKPDIVAPGRDILSALPGGGYGSLEGTSMAGPHVAGVVALLWSADPSLIGDIDRTEHIIIETVQLYTGSTSIGCFDGGVPNAAYGYGVVDVYAAVKEALGK